MRSINDLFVGCPVVTRWINGFVLRITDDDIDPNILVSHGMDRPQWFYANELDIIRWGEPEKLSRLIQKQLLNEVSNG